MSTFDQAYEEGFEYAKAQGLRRTWANRFAREFAQHRDGYRLGIVVIRLEVARAYQVWLDHGAIEARAGEDY